MTSAFVAVLIAATVVSALLTPVIARLGRSEPALQAFPETRVRTPGVSRLGGVAVLLAAAFALGLAALRPEGRDALGGEHSSLQAMWVGALIVAGVGFADDLRPLGALWKLGAQSIAALVVVASGVRIETFRILDHPVELGFFSVPMTLLWIVALTNAFNLIDGLDGLATGVAIIIGAGNAFLLFRRGQFDEAFVVVALLGGAIGFLPYNFLGRRIFLGDGGSLLFGFVLSVAAVTAWQKGPVAMSISAPLLLFGVPLMEVCVSVARRSVQGLRRAGLRGLMRILIADEDHIHHRLVQLGLAPRTVVILLCTISLGTCLLSIALLRNAL